MKMTEQQKLDYKMYRKECAMSNVEPVLRDFLTGEMPWPVCYQLELQQNEMSWPQLRAMAAHA